MMLPPKEQLVNLTVALLRLAAEKFSNRGCNDFDTNNFVGRDGAVALEREWEEHNSKGKDFSGRGLYDDWILMLLMARLIEEGKL
jgi:hypothetical protein